MMTESSQHDHCSAFQPVKRHVDLEEYEQLRSKYPEARFQPGVLVEDSMREHKISLVDASTVAKLRRGVGQGASQQLFSIVQTQFYGLQYTYEVIIGPFRLKVLVLNLLRQADSGTDDFNVQQLGSGTFGTVSEIKLREGSSFATKRIPFHFKINPDEGYDFEENKAEELQLKRCLKQFCFYKIFSLLGIGPRIVSTGYDLICFNNCIEFKMELCEPITNEFSYRGIEIDQCSDDLCSRLFLLHSLNIVHRDIKPENVLYSPSRQRFVFGDFGMAALLNHQYPQKTLTKFMGTPSYCSEEMKALLNGGSGRVNLYLNDFHALRLTLTTFHSNFITQHSKITSNSMSYNEYEDSFFGSTSFQPAQQSARSAEEVLTDQSPNPTRNSLASLPTACTLAPHKHAALINHFESEVVYDICRKMQRKVDVPEQLIDEQILCRYSQFQNQEIMTNLAIEIRSIFGFEFKQHQPIQHLIKQWRNSSRHYGPEHFVTTKLLGDLLAQVDEKTATVIRDVEKKVSRAKGNLKQDRIELLIHKELHNTRGFVYSLISMLNTSLRLKDHRNQQSAINSDLDLEIANNYISAIFGILPYCREAFTITSLAIRYFGLESMESEPQECRVERIMDLCYELLRQNSRISIATTYRYITYLLEEIKTANWNQRQPIVAKEIHRLSQELQSMQIDDKILFIYLVVYIASLKHQMNFSIDANGLVERINQIVINSEQSSEIDSKLIYSLLYVKAELMFTQRNFTAALDYCRRIIDRVNAAKARKEPVDVVKIVDTLQLMGLIQLQSCNYELAEQHLGEALVMLESNSGSLYRAKHVYNILNNLIVVAYRQQHYVQALKQSEELIQFLLKVDFPKKEVKIVMTYQYCIGMVFMKGLDEQGRYKIREYIGCILQHLYSFFQGSTVWPQLSAMFTSVFYPQSYSLNLSETIFIQQKLIELFKSSSRYRYFFQYQYAGANYELAKYYIRDMRQKLKGISHLWNYLRIILSNNLPHQLREIDYQVVQIYAQCLINNQANRLAVRFLNHFLKYIPEIFAEIKLKCLQLMHKALQRVAGPHKKLYHELTKHNCKRVREKSFKSVVESIARNSYERKLVGTALKGLFFVEVDTLEDII